MCDNFRMRRRSDDYYCTAEFRLNDCEVDDDEETN